MVVDAGRVRIESGGKDYQLSDLTLGVTTDYEWTLLDHLRLTAGALSGLSLLGGRDLNPPPDAVIVYEPAADPKKKTSTDRGEAVWTIWPRADLLIGPRQGFQWGGGAAYRLSSKSTDEVLRDYRQSPWVFETGISYTGGGL